VHATVFTAAFHTIATVLDRKLAASHYLIVTLTMRMSSCGLSVRLFVLAFEMFCMTSMPFVTLPNTVCLLSSQGCQITHMNIIYGNIDGGNKEITGIILSSVGRPKG